jgi:hypothetical protein
MIINVLCFLLKVADSIPYGVIKIFDLQNNFFRIIAMGTTQPVT